MQLRNNITPGNLKYTTEKENNYNFSKYSLPFVF